MCACMYTKIYYIYINVYIKEETDRQCEVEGYVLERPHGLEVAEEQLEIGQGRGSGGVLGKLVDGTKLGEDVKCSARTQVQGCTSLARDVDVAPDAIRCVGGVR